MRPTDTLHPPTHTTPRPTGPNWALQVQAPPMPPDDAYCKLGATYLTPREVEARVEKESRRVMTAAEAEAFVLELLGDGRKHTTMQVDRASQRAGKRCPDATVRFLAKLRLLGKIHGEMSMEHRTWLWWHPSHPDAKPPQEEPHDP